MHKDLLCFLYKLLMLAKSASILIKKNIVQIVILTNIITVLL